MTEAILQVRDLEVTFPGESLLPWRRPPPFHAVRHASFDVGRREIVGLVGESGSGKTTLSRALLRLQPISSGSIGFDGLDLLALDRAGMARLRRRMQVVFQDPYTSLNPRMTAGRNVAEGMLLQRVCNRGEAVDRAVALLRQVGLPADAARRYPHEFSGGQRQRIGIARALAVEPEFLIADEPVSALDMSIQAQILNLLLEQQEQRGLSVLFIGHDLSVIRQVCDRVIVMCRGSIVEIAPTEALFNQPMHPYTQSLLKAVPVAHPTLRRPVASGVARRWVPVETGSALPLPMRICGPGHLVAEFALCSD